MKFIPLDAVLAEIDRMFDKHSSKHDINEAGVVLLQLRENVETIEAKEVELDMKTFGEEVTNVFNLPSNETTNTEEEPLNWEYAIAKHFFELGLKAKDWEKERMEECPYRQVGCTMYEGHILECKGACSWVVDYPKLKELKAKKGE